MESQQEPAPQGGGNNMSEDRRRHLIAIKDIEERLVKKNKFKSGDSAQPRPRENNIPAALEDWGRGGPSSGGDAWASNTSSGGGVWSDNKPKQPRNTSTEQDFEPILERLNKEPQGSYRDFYDRRNATEPNNNNNNNDEYQSSNSRSGQQVGYQMRDLRTGQNLLFNPNAEEQDQIIQSMDDRGGSGSRRNINNSRGFENAPSQRQNWPPQADARHRSGPAEPWTSNPMYDYNYGNSEYGYHDPRSEQSQHRYPVDRGEYYPPRQHWNGGYGDYEREYDQFYEPQHHHNHHQQQQQQQRSQQHHHFSERNERGLFGPSPTGAAEWGNNNPSNDYRQKNRGTF